MAPQSIFFDVDGVVVNGYHFKPELRRVWDEHLEADLGISPKVFYEEFISKAFVNEVLPGKKSLITALDEALPKLGYTGTAIDIAAYWMERDSHVSRPLLSVIRGLRGKGIKLYLATNQEHLRAFHLWHGLGLKHVFDDIFYSARVGNRKPDAAFFEKVTALTGPHEQAPLFFDDTPEVVKAALAAGWNATIYNTLEDFTTHPSIQHLLEK